MADWMRIITSESSRWMHQKFGYKAFEWQEGYGTFSIGHSQMNVTGAYIAGQQEHRRQHDFQAEFLAFLKKNHVEYDARYI